MPNTNDSNTHGTPSERKFLRKSSSSYVSEGGKGFRNLPDANVGLFVKALVGVLSIADRDGLEGNVGLSDLAGEEGVEELARSLVTGGHDLSAIPDACDFSDQSNITMTCRDVACLLLAVDRESHDTGSNSFTVERRFGDRSKPISQLCNISDVLVFMSEHALTKVKVPILPLVLITYDSCGGFGDMFFIRSRFGRTNFSFDENGAPVLSQREQAQLTMPNDKLMTILTEFYACFDQRFEAIFFPSIKSELAMLSCAAQTSVASAIWQHAAIMGLPEEQGDTWLVKALLGGDETSLFEKMVAPYMSDEDANMSLHDRYAKSLEALSGMGITFPPASVPNVFGPGRLMGSEAMGYDSDDMVQSHLYEIHSLLSSFDATPYPLLRIPEEIDPDRSAMALVLSRIRALKGLPMPSDIIASFMRSFDLTESIPDRHQRSEVAQAINAMCYMIDARTGTEFPSYDKTTVVTKDVQLQYVLSMFADASMSRDSDAPLSFRQLEALAMGYKTESIKQAIASDFKLDVGIRTEIGDIISEIVSGLADDSLERERAICGEMKVDPIRFTLSAMAMPERLTSTDAHRMQLSPQHMMSMLIEMPSAFSDAYGKIVGNRMLAAYTRSNGRSVSSNIKVYQPFFMLHDDARFGSRTIQSEGAESSPQILLNRVMTDEDDKYWSAMPMEEQMTPLPDKAISDFMTTFPSRAYEVIVVRAFLSIICGIDLGQFHGRSYQSVNDSKELLLEAITNNVKAVASIRSGGRYEVHPSVIRIADVLFRHMSHWNNHSKYGNGELADLTALYHRSVILSLMIHLLADNGSLSDVLPVHVGSMFEAIYPRSWEGSEQWFAENGNGKSRQEHGVRHHSYNDALDRNGSSGSDRILSRSADLGKLLACSVDMTASAEASSGANIVERDEELQEIISVLLRREKSNIMILGEAGTGKTALVELLASSISSGKVPDRLKNKHLLQMDVMTLASYPEATLSELLEDARGKDVILFIDEIHALQPRTLNALKPYIARADISLIGATTNSEYQSTILKDKALARRFSTIRLHELTQGQTITCLKSRMTEYEQWYGVAYDTKTPYAIATAASTYMTNRHSPDRELDVMDVAGSIASMASRTVVIEDDVYAAVRQLTSNKSVLSITDIQKSIEDKGNGITDRIEMAFGDIVSQEDAKRVVSEALALSQIGLRSGGSPKNVLMFVGPSNVGKSMMAERIPKFLGTAHDAVLSINLGEYIGKHEYSRLVGSPPGYIGFEQGGLLTNFGMAHPDGVVIFDALEKASPAMRQVLSDLFDRGYIMSAAGEKVDCRSMTFVCTSNEGFDTTTAKRIGFLDMDDGKTYETRVLEIRESLVKSFGASFVGRFDEIVFFDELGVDDILQTCRNEYNVLVNDYRKSRGIDITKVFTMEDLDEMLKSISKKEVAAIGAKSIMRRVDREIKKALTGMREKRDEIETL